MGIAESVASWLKSLGHEAIHLNDQSLNQLEDFAILEKAIEEKRIIITTDMDFGQLLAFSKHTLASVIQFRTSVFTPDNIRQKLQLVFDGFSNNLEEGFIMTVEDHRIRFRKLPV
jgi:predicted nuclease of predicted toxin-antitoxin system